MTSPLPGQSRSALTPSVLAWLGEDADRVLFFVTHWRRRTFTGRTFHLDPKTGTQNTEET